MNLFLKKHFRVFHKGITALSKEIITLCKVIALKINNRNIVRNIAIIYALIAITLLSFNTSGNAQGTNKKVKTVVIDAGHGGNDPGTHGVSTKEKDLVLKIALKTGKYIEKYLPEVKVIYTRKDDRFLELHERADIANKNKADLFISIHANALGKSTVHGTETYVMGLHTNEKNFNVAKRENSVILLEEDHEEKYEGFDPNSPESYIIFSMTQNAYLDNSLLLANNIEMQFKKRAGRKSLGVKQAGFQVLWNTYMPSVLVEIGYLTNLKEEKELNTIKVQDYIASGIFRAFRDYKTQIESIN